LVAVAQQGRPETVAEAIDLLYEIQDSLMFGSPDEE
jgi:hypothetical protein